MQLPSSNIANETVIKVEPKLEVESTETFILDLPIVVEDTVNNSPG
jgi:hypothetical protein